MSAAEVFSLSGMIAMPMWLLMIVLPKWKATRFLIDFKIVPLILAVVYTIYVFMSIQQTGLDFGRLASVKELFTYDNAMLAGWVHYLAFDLLVGMWIINENRSLGIHQIILAPVLFATFMLGPVGFLLFMIIRAIKTNKS